MVAPLIAAAGIGAIASLMGGRSQRKADSQRQAALDARDDSKFQRATVDAKKAGLHPLFALGQGGVSPPPQAAGGSTYQRAGDAVGRAVTGAYSQYATEKNQQIAQTPSDYERQMQALNLANMTRQNQLLDLRLIRESGSTNGSGGAPSGLPLPTGSAQDSFALDEVINPKIIPSVQEVKHGRVDPYVKGKREQSLNIKSPMTQVRIGSQNVWVPVEEVDEFMENPLAVGGLTYIYKGNDNVDWRKVAEEYSGRKMGQSLHDRNPAAYRSGAKFRAMLIKNASKSRRDKVQSTFFRKKSRQRRGY